MTTSAGVVAASPKPVQTIKNATVRQFRKAERKWNMGTCSESWWCIDPEHQSIAPPGIQPGMRSVAFEIEAIAGAQFVILSFEREREPAAQNEQEFLSFM